MQISIVLPVLNEEKNIKRQIQDVKNVCERLNLTHEIIAVDDGSFDETPQILQKLHGTVSTITFEKNQGYGAALRAGFSKAKYEWIFFTDADRQFNINDLEYFIKNTKTADMIIGWRKLRNDPWRRKLNAKLYNLLIRLLFNLQVKDINCAFKLFKADLLKQFPLQSNGAFINAELLIKAKRSSANIIELPVSHFAREFGKPTGARLTVILRAWRECLVFLLKKRI